MLTEPDRDRAGKASQNGEVDLCDRIVPVRRAEGDADRT